MKWEMLKRTGEAPENGWMLAYLRKEVLFIKYGSRGEVKGKIGSEDLLELHLFDKKKEYRCIASQSKRYKDGFVETVADFDEKTESTYSDDIYLEKNLYLEKDFQGLGEKIQLLNHLKYDENGMLEVDNYRLVMKGE